MRAFGAGGTNRKVVKQPKAITRNPRDQTNNFELRVLQHDQVDSACEFARKYVRDNEK